MRIISVGIDSLTAAYVKNGRVVRVEIRAETVLAGVGDKGGSVALGSARAAD